MPARRNSRRSKLVAGLPAPIDPTMPPIPTPTSSTTPRRTRSSRALSTGPYPSSSGPSPVPRRSGSAYSPSATAIRLSPDWLPPSPASHPLMTFHKAGKKATEGKKKPNGPIAGGKGQISRDCDYSGDNEMGMEMILPPGQVLSPPALEARGLPFDSSAGVPGREGSPGLPSLVPSEGSSARSSLGDALYSNNEADYMNRGTVNGSHSSLVHGLPVQSLANGMVMTNRSASHFSAAPPGFDLQAARSEVGPVYSVSPYGSFPSQSQAQHSPPQAHSIAYNHSSYPSAMSYPPTQSYQAFPSHFQAGPSISMPMSMPTNAHEYLSSHRNANQTYQVSMASSLPYGAGGFANTMDGTINQNQLQSRPSYGSRSSGDMQSYSMGMAMDRPEMTTGEEEGSLSPGPSSGLDSSEDEGESGEDETDGNGHVLKKGFAAGGIHARALADGERDAQRRHAEEEQKPGVPFEAGLQTMPLEGTTRALSDPAAGNGYDNATTNKRQLTLKVPKRPTVAPEHWVHDDMRSLAASLSPNKGEFDQSAIGAGPHIGPPMTAAERLEAAEKALHNGPPRPPNAWILYRSDKLRALANGEKLPGVDAIMAKRSSESPSEEDPAKGTGAAGVAISKKLKSKAKSSKTSDTLAQIDADAALDSTPKIPQADISKLISLMWKKEGKVVRNRYDRMAEVKKIEHQIRYPDYKFQPMKKEDKAKLRVERDIAKEHAKAAAKEDKQKLRKEQVEQVRKERLAGKLMNEQKSHVSRKKTSRAPSPGGNESYAKALDNLGSPIAQSLATEGGFSPTAVLPASGAVGESTSRTRVSRKKKSSSRSVHTAGPPADWVATEDSIWRQPPRPGPSREIFWAVAPETEQVPPDSMLGRSSFGGHPPGHNHEQYQVVEMMPTDSQGHPVQQYRSLRNQFENSSEQVPEWQSTSTSTQMQGLANPALEPGYALDGQQVIPYYFEPIPHQTQLIGQPNGQALHVDGGHQLNEQPLVMTYSYLPDGGFGASEAIPGVSEAELAEMWALLQEEEGPVVGLKSTSMPVEEAWSSDPTTALEQWAELGPTIQDMTPVPTNTLSGQIAERITEKWAGDSAQAQQGLRQARVAPPMPTIHSGFSSGPVTGSFMSYDKPGYVTIQVPIDQMDQAFPGQAVPMRNRGQGPFLTTEKPISPIDTEFTMQPQHLQSTYPGNGQGQFGSIRPMVPMVPTTYTSLGQIGGEMRNAFELNGRGGLGRSPSSTYEAKAGSGFSAHRFFNGDSVSAHGQPMAGLGIAESSKPMESFNGSANDMTSHTRSGPIAVPMYVGVSTVDSARSGGLVEYTWSQPHDGTPALNHNDSHTRGGDFYTFQPHQSSDASYPPTHHSSPIISGGKWMPVPAGYDHPAAAGESGSRDINTIRGDTMPQRGARRSPAVGLKHQ